ncbi:hypothetical protein CTI12_AA091680 [Artemisia annua]|uniref:Mediator complex subunit 15 KIX domain-containing protein n=1 Tax=Artemisia annua TaxID=35608 RepID=A0A2U1Q023_ARTAN|nr:hypothetical protein CTI12_AA091680 [Artemisia annua]
MDSSNRIPNQGDSSSTEQAVDWRTKLPPEYRRKLVNKIIATFGKHLPSTRQESLNELKGIAMRFEQKCYTTATSHSDYMRKISLKLMKKNTSANPVPNPLPCNVAVNSSDPGSQGMQQVNNQGQAPPIPVPSNHPQATNQSIHSNVASPGVQGSAGVSPGTGISQSTMPNIPGQNSSLQNIQNISGIPQNGVGNSMGNGVSPNKFVSQRQIPGRQQPAPQQQQQSQNLQHYQPQLQQIVKQQPQQNNSTTSMQSHIQKQHQNMLHSGDFQPSQQSVLQPSMLQPASLSTGRQNQSAQPVIRNHQQPVLRQQRQQQQQAQSSPMGDQTSSTNLHLSKLIGQSGGFSEMQQQQHPRLMGQQKNISSSQQHSIGQHNNFSAIHQQHFGSQSSFPGQQRQQNQLHGNPTMLNNQQSSLLLQSKVAVPQQNQTAQGQRSQLELQQQAVTQTQSGQLPHQLTMNPQPNMLQRDMQQRLSASGLFQQKNVIDQQKLLQQQRAMPEASSTSSDSTAQTGNPNTGDRQEEVYQKIQIMKDKYMPAIKDLYQKFTGKLLNYDSLSRKPTAEQVEKMKVIVKQLEACMGFMQIPKNRISPDHIEKIGAIERNILQLINTYKHILQQPNMNSLQQSNLREKVHLTQMQPHQNQINSQIQPVNLQHNNMVSLQHNAVSPLPLVSSAQQNMTGMLQPNTNMIPHQQLKQPQSRQMPQQMLHKHQPLHHQQKFHQQNGRLQVNQLPQLNHINDGNDLKIRHQTRVMSETLQQQIRAPFSPQIDQQNVLTSVTKSSTPSQSVNSSFIVSSPSTISTSHMVGDSGKADSGAPPRCIAGNIGNQSILTIATPGISASPLLSEFTSPDGNHGNGASIVAEKPTTVEDPMERLLKVVNSISTKSLSASISDIDTAISMMDSIAGTAPSNVSRVEVDEDLVSMAIDHLQESAVVTQDGSAINMMDSIAVDEDLVAIIKDYLQESAFVTQDGTTGTRKMKRWSANESFMHLNCLEASELECTATHTIKRPRIERNHALLEEIKIINQGLIDTVVDISESNADPPAVSELGEGTVVKCSYCPVALGPHLKSHRSTSKYYIRQLVLLWMIIRLKRHVKRPAYLLDPSVDMNFFLTDVQSPIQPLQLFVPPNYPNCSPVLLDKVPVEVGQSPGLGWLKLSIDRIRPEFPIVSKEYEDLSIKAKWRFSSSLRKLSEPMSLKDMAKTWDVCARAVVAEYAQQTAGGGTFTSKYGAWEDCLTAS